MNITKNGISYSVAAVLENHCCEIECCTDGQRGGWLVRCISNEAAAKSPIIVREFHAKEGLGEAMTKAAKFYLKKK